MRAAQHPSCAAVVGDDSDRSACFAVHVFRGGLMDYFAKSATREIEYPGDLAPGTRGSGVQRLQEWLSLRGSPTAIDGGFGDATSAALAAFRAKNGLGGASSLNAKTWNVLVEPMASLIAPAVQIAARDTLSAIVLKVAKAHLKAHPIEVGGDNSGPWVRAYMSGNDGPDWLWCAGFVTAIVAQAATLLDVVTPLPRTFSCDSLAKDAQQSGRSVRGTAIESDAGAWATMGICCVFVVRKTPNDWTHTGFAFNGAGTVFETVEGNTNDGGSPNGFEVTTRHRSTGGKDFVRLD
jgi:hypothetical protein